MSRGLWSGRIYVEAEQVAEIKGLILECGRPVKDGNWSLDGDWRDYDWPHSENGCEGWEATEQSELVLVPAFDEVLFTVTHCRCACRVHPHVTVGLEGTLGG
jgi:hypothetical protein